MRFDNPAYMTKGYSERIPEPQKLIIFNEIQKISKQADCDYIQFFTLEHTLIDGMTAQKIKHTQEQPPYEKEYFLLTDVIVKEKVFVIDDETHHTYLLGEEY